jgi:hypothetical protein
LQLLIGFLRLQGQSEWTRALREIGDGAAKTPCDNWSVGTRKFVALGELLDVARCRATAAEGNSMSAAGVRITKN